MPPRIQPTRLPLPSSCQCLRTQSSILPEAYLSSRSFHASPPTLEGNLDEKKTSDKRRSTKLRRDMKEWLAGPGFRFRRQRPDSTNYLSAYNKAGQLKRAGRARVSAGLPTPAEVAATEEMLQRQEVEEGIDEAERTERAEARASERARQAANARRTPKETAADLRPFPLNHNFRSQPVLSEELRDELYGQVVVRGMDLQSVSAAYSVDMRRVAAVVRLKTIEKEWIESGKKLAKPYNDAVLAMLPQTNMPGPNQPVNRHEGINDVSVHPATRKQIFHPTSESRVFTREDAAKIFSPTLLPVDQRIPHPELVQLERWNLEGLSREKRNEKFVQMDDEMRATAEEKERKRKEWEERTQRTVPGRRWDFKFQDISVEDVGKDGRSSKGVGLRYGMPHTDRKRGEYKIPASVS